MKSILLSRAIALPVVLILSSAPALSVPPPPIFNPGEQMFLQWTPGEVRCSGDPVEPVMMQRPAANLRYTKGSIRQAYHFRIDDEGRALSVVSERGPSYTAVTDDVGAALTASIFKQGAPQSDCHVEYRSTVTPLDQVPLADLYLYTLAPADRALYSAAQKRLEATPGGCMARPRPAPLRMSFPDFDRIPASPGTRDWAMVGYDLDAGGHPVRPHILAGSGNGALDKASIKAVRDSRYVDGARKGCLTPYWLAAAPLLSPLSTPPDQKPANAQCAGELRWTTTPRLIYPLAYRRRSIEGWAQIAYDVAPWGETGNIQVLASEPSAAFGQQAMQMIRAARKEKSPTGASACVETIRFVIGKAAPSEPQDEPIILD